MPEKLNKLDPFNILYNLDVHQKPILVDFGPCLMCIVVIAVINNHGHWHLQSSPHNFCRMEYIVKTCMILASAVSPLCFKLLVVKYLNFSLRLLVLQIKCFLFIFTAGQ